MLNGSNQNLQDRQASAVLHPPFRRIRGYAFDPSFSTRLETAQIHEAIYRIPWEPLDPGPVGEYFEVINRDPARFHQQLWHIEKGPSRRALLFFGRARAAKLTTTAV